MIECAKAYHASTRLSGIHEALLVDPGANSSLMGEDFFNRVSAIARKHVSPLGKEQLLPQRTALQSAVNVGGVGSGSQLVDRSVGFHCVHVRMWPCVSVRAPSWSQ